MKRYDPNDDFEDFPVGPPTTWRDDAAAIVFWIAAITAWSAVAWLLASLIS